MSKCQCVRCQECNGQGHIWLDLFGKYLGNRRCDDMDTMTTCDECRGSGIEEICDYCRDRLEEELV